MTGNKRPRLEDRRASLEHQSDPAAKPRLTRACAECKRQKIKCEVQPGQTSCNKCLRSGIECVAYNFAQKFVDEDASWKAQATSTIEQLRSAVQRLLQHNNLPELSRFGPVLSPIRPISTTSNGSNKVSPGNFLSEGPSVAISEDDSELIPLPMNNLYTLTEPRNSRLIRVDPADANGPDFISRGVVSTAEAEYLFSHYRDHINPLLWDGVLCPHRSLHDARRASTLLVATVLTVAALQTSGREKILHAVHDAFVSLMRGSCLLRSQSLDDIRGLCIGAFYLTSLSWALCSRAVRVATEMNLHKSSLQLRGGSPEAYERVRLWYVLYVCDHQFALAYGRPPMMHDDAAIRNVDKFLSNDLSTNGDRKLIAQVNLFRILADAYFMYGCDADLELEEKDFQRLRSFNVSIDQWRLAYQLRSSDTPLYRTYPSKEIVLYYHFARFQLNSMSLRGISAHNAPEKVSYADLSFDRREAANIAIEAARGTLKLIVEEPDLCMALVGMPIFAHAMIAVCASFLLKLAVVFGTPATRLTPLDHKIVVSRDLTRLGLTFHAEDALSLVQDLTRVLSAMADKASHRHVARHVVTGLKEVLQRFTRVDGGPNFVYSRSGNNQPISTTYHPYPTLSYSNSTNPATRRNSSSNLDLETGATSSQVERSTNFDPVSHNLNQDPFDLMGDLDWRFNDSVLWGLNNDEPYAF
ncbi:uncharacterized protein Z518_10160 [Rhinocladiella mackenziei CBS 650.93]|uniref:Zn(2)-C6 fungal-type domain-containing protein n=1 Tax=Rhinocladiella mackenziei CBS 650.93 TaxID=1442369 RepID=A0A0D2I5N0_9EURO|nr:uncharacterized protein Z518_10160 [Rhinocladiella mackenziei CBS 650.93]KIX01094.1 hypothetical protein Z518_10160 [Rhinocladiella mackenziei CBS 650.93]